MNAIYPAKLAEMMAEFKDLDDLSDRYETLIDLGRELPAMDEAQKTPECLVHGCQSVLHVHSEIKDGKVYFSGWADALIVNGLVSFFVLGCSGMNAKDFLTLDPDFIRETGVVASLTPSRVNGFYNIHKKLTDQVKTLLNPSQE